MTVSSASSRFHLHGTILERRRNTFYWLWIFAIAAYGVGDIVTTIAIIEFSDRLVEANALVSFAVERFGIPGFVGLKLFVFFAFLGIQIRLLHGDPEDWALALSPPIVLGLGGTVTTAHNLSLLFA